MFITFEGLDFCGKSTQVKLLKNYLSEKNEDVLLLREPGGTDISEKVREILLDKKNSKMFMETELLLFSSSRTQLINEIIKPGLQEGTFIISDRFHDSLTAYQGYGRGITLEFIKNLNNFVLQGTLPDLTFLIDIPVEESIKRRKSRVGQELDRIERSDATFYENVRSGYLAIAKNEERIKVINGLGTIEEIHAQIKEYVESVI